MTPRIPRFETHIRPMMRKRDRDEMLKARNFDLWKFEDVRDWADRILNRVTRGLTLEGGTMPPPTEGGPWPAEWIALFERWVDCGCPRLEMASGTYTMTRFSPTLLQLRASGTNPTFGYQTWLEHDGEPAASSHLRLFREPPDPVPLFGTLEFAVDIDIPDVGAASVLVTDSDGDHVIAVPEI